MNRFKLFATLFAVICAAQSANAVDYTNNNLGGTIVDVTTYDNVSIINNSDIFVNLGSVISFDNISNSASITNNANIDSTDDNISVIYLQSNTTPSKSLNSVIINNSTTGRIINNGTGSNAILIERNNASSTINNSGFIDAPVFSIKSSDGGLNITNSNMGTISGNISSAALLSLTNRNNITGNIISQGSVSVTNSGNITGNITSQAFASITNSGNIFGNISSTTNINLTIQNDSNITGNITGANGINVLNIAQTTPNPLGVDEFITTLDEKLVGTWQKNASTNSRVLVDNGQTLGVASLVGLSGGTITNNGTLILNTATSGTLNNSSTATINSLSGGTINNFSNLTATSVSGGTINNFSNLTATSVSDGTINNSGTATLGATLSNATFNNNGGSVVRSGGALALVNSDFTNNGVNIDNITFTVDVDSSLTNQHFTDVDGNNQVGIVNAVNLNGGTVHNGATNDEAAAATATINSVAISSGTFTNHRGASVTTLTTFSGGTFNNNAGSALTTITSMSGGTFNHSSATTVSSATMTGGTIVNNTSGQITTINATAGTITNNGAITTLSMNSGAAGVNLTSSGTVSNLNFSKGTISNSGTITSLKLIEGQDFGNIANTGTITSISNGTDGSANIAYGNVLSGNGAITKTGSGRLEITGANNTHSGTFTISAGELKVNGVTASQVVANNGTTVSGIGTIGSLTLNSGANLASGNSIGTLNANLGVAINGGSNSNFEFNQVAIDKTIAGGNITIANGAIANFNLENNAAGGYFVVDQNILETTGGTVSGQYTSVKTQEGYVTDLQYSAQAVRATIATKLDSNVLDGTLASQNTIGRILTKTVSDKLLDGINDSKEAKMWISTGSFNNNRDAVANSSKHSSSGFITSAGVTKSFDDFDLIAGIFNAKSYVKRYYFTGNNEIDTNGAVLGFGKNIKTNAGDIYLLAQIGGGLYSSNNDRYVNVNGGNQNAQSSNGGKVQYASLNASYKLPINIDGEFNIFASTRLQKTSNASSQENGLTAGNLNFSQSSAQTINHEIGTAYKNGFAKFLHLPQNSFFRVEFSGFKTDLYSKRNSVVTMGSASYNLAPKYEENLLLGVNGLISVPLLENTNFVANAGQRQNGRYKEFNGNIGLVVSF